MWVGGWVWSLTRARARQALPKHSLQRTASGGSRRRAACRSSARVWVRVAVSAQQGSEQRLAWRVISGSMADRSGLAQVLGRRGPAVQGSGCGGAGQQASTVHSVSLIVAWYVCGHAEAHRKLSVAARHVVSGGRAHRHGVVVKLVALVVRERRVVRRSRPLELGVRVHGLGLGCSLQTWCLVVCFETRAIACVCGNRRGRCVGNKTFHEKRAAARVFHL